MKKLLAVLFFCMFVSSPVYADTEGIIKGDLCLTIYEAMPLHLPDQTDIFIDVDTQNDYYLPAAALYEAGLLKGSEEADGLYAYLNEPISVSEGAAMLRAAYAKSTHAKEENIQDTNGSVVEIETIGRNESAEDDLDVAYDESEEDDLDVAYDESEEDETDVAYDESEKDETDVAYDESEEDEFDVAYDESEEDDLDVAYDESEEDDLDVAYDESEEDETDVAYDESVEDEPDVAFDDDYIDKEELENGYAKRTSNGVIYYTWDEYEDEDDYETAVMEEKPQLVMQVCVNPEKAVVATESSETIVKSLPADAVFQVNLTQEGGEQMAVRLEEFEYLSVSGGNIAGFTPIEQTDGAVAIDGNKITLKAGEAFNNIKHGDTLFTFEAWGNPALADMAEPITFQAVVTVAGDEDMQSVTQVYLIEAATVMSNPSQLEYSGNTITIKEGFTHLYDPAIVPKEEGISVSLIGISDLALSFSESAKWRIAEEALKNGDSCFHTNINGRYNENDSYTAVPVSINVEPFITEYKQRNLETETVDLLFHLENPVFSFENGEFVFTYTLDGAQEATYLDRVSSYGDAQIELDAQELRVILNPSAYLSTQLIQVPIIGHCGEVLKSAERTLFIDGFEPLADVYKVYDALVKNESFGGCDINYDPQSQKWLLSYGPFIGTSGDQICIEMEDGNTSVAAGGYLNVLLDTMTPILRAQYDEGIANIEAVSDGTVGFKLTVNGRKDIVLDGAIALNTAFAREAERSLAVIREGIENFTGELYHGGEAVVIENGAINATLPEGFEAVFAPGIGEAASIDLDDALGVVFNPPLGTGKGNYLVTVAYGGFEVPAGYFKYQYDTDEALN